MPRLNTRLLTNDRNYVYLSSEKSGEFMASDLKYFKHADDEAKFYALSLWAVCDPDTERGRALLYDAINFYEMKAMIRLAPLMQSVNSSSNLIKKAILYALEKMPYEQARTFIKRILREKTFKELKSGQKKFAEIDAKDLDLSDIDEKINAIEIDEVLKRHAQFIRDTIGFGPEQNAGIVDNIWLIGTFDDEQEFVESDFSFLESFIRKTGLDKIREPFSKIQLKALIHFQMTRS